MHATQEAKQPIAIVIPHEQHLRSYLNSKGIDSSHELSDLCDDPKIQAIVLKECNAIGKKNGFKPAELLQAVILTPTEWTPENGFVTAAQKIQRAKIAKKFEKEIKVSFTLLLIELIGLLTRVLFIPRRYTKTSDFIIRFLVLHPISYEILLHSLFALLVRTLCRFAFSFSACNIFVELLPHQSYQSITFTRVNCW